MLQFTDASLRRGPRVLFERASFQIHPGQNIGLTGANGTGKSSLFAMVLGELSTDEGHIALPNNWEIAHVAQDMPGDQQAAIEYVLDGDTGLRHLEQAIADAEANNDGEKIAHLHSDFDHIGGYQARSRAAQLMAGLSFSVDDEQRALADFSGGWRMRLKLARALMCRSDLLLLDEPTNHLDLDAVIWLESWLKQYQGTLLLISHDRDFLDSVVSHILHIEQASLTLYSGNYTAFERIRTEKLAHQQAAHEKQQREVAHMQSFVERFKAKATKAKQAQSRVKALERMQLIAPAHVDSPFDFHFKEPKKNPHPLLQIDLCDIGYGDNVIVNQARLTLTPGDRIGLLGPNGAGKSTLIKLLAGELQPMSGERIEAKDLNIGYFAQHQLEQLRMDQSPLQHMQKLDPKATEAELRSYLGGFAFNGDKALEAVEPFSGGEKSRLVLAMVVYQRPNLLLLDEPTNHLDLEMRQALAQALQEFSGAMVIVSHDRHLLRVSCDQLLLVANHTVDEFKDDLDHYPAWLNAHAKQISSDNEQPADDQLSKKDRKRIEAEQRKKLQPLKRAADRFEKQLDELQTKQQDLEALLGDMGLYEDDRKQELRDTLADKQKIDAQVDDIEERWMDALEQLEQASV